jgi:hypothetical protein
LGEDGQVVQLPLDDYLTCVLLAEMPVSFEDEALKAQSVVARTYTMRAEKGAAKHAEASVCTNSTCCQGYLSVDAFLGKGGKATDVQRIRDLVASTDGQVLTYDGNLIEATYFSCSGGTTEDAVAVWGTDVPYLQSVASPGEEHATHYSDTVTFDASDFASKLGMALAGKPSTWFGNTTYTAGGGVATMTIGEKLFAGTERYIANLIITVLCFVVLSFLLNWVVSIINRFFKLPVLKQANKILGGLLGALCGGIVVVILCFTLQIASHVVYKAEFVNAVENSIIVQTVLSDEKVLEGIEALK